MRTPDYSTGDMEHFRVNLTMTIDFEICNKVPIEVKTLAI
jgi:hypothetical protein